MVPLFLKTAYKTEPLFANSELVYGLFDTPFENIPGERFFQKAAINNLKESDLEAFRNPDGTASIHRGATAFSDGVIIGSESFDASVDYIANERINRFKLGYRRSILTQYPRYPHNLLEVNVEQ